MKLPKLKGAEKDKVLLWLWSQPVENIMPILKKIFVYDFKEGDKDIEIDLIMHKALILKIQLRPEKTIQSKLQIGVLKVLREDIERALYKVWYYLKLNNIDYDLQNKDIK